MDRAGRPEWKRCRCCGRVRLVPVRNRTCSLCLDECTNEGCVVAPDPWLDKGTR